MSTFLRNERRELPPEAEQAQARLTAQLLIRRPPYLLRQTRLGEEDVFPLRPKRAAFQAALAFTQTPSSPTIPALLHTVLVYFYSAPVVWFNSALDILLCANRISLKVLAPAISYSQGSLASFESGLNRGLVELVSSQNIDALTIDFKFEQLPANFELESACKSPCGTEEPDLQVSLKTPGAPSLAQKHFTIRYNDTGYSYESIFWRLPGRRENGDRRGSCTFACNTKSPTSYASANC